LCPNMLQEGCRMKSKWNAHYLAGACDRWPRGFHWGRATPAIFGALWRKPNQHFGWYIPNFHGHNHKLTGLTRQFIQNDYLEQILPCRKFNICRWKAVRAPKA
jgi:hypothetical protein